MIVFDEETTRFELLALDDRSGQKVGSGRYLIRVTHIPTGMAVTVSDSRGQRRARDFASTALQMMIEDFT